MTAQTPQQPHQQPNSPALDSGAIGRLTEALADDLDAILVALWQAETEKGYEFGRAKVRALVESIVRAHVTAALAEVESRIEAERWQFPPRHRRRSWQPRRSRLRGRQPHRPRLPRGGGSMSDVGTFHGSRERVSWSVTRNTSTTLFGDDEEQARADYERRRKTLHRGESIRLERLVVAEAWVQHLDVIDETAKEPADD